MGPAVAGLGVAAGLLGAFVAGLGVAAGLLGAAVGGLDVVAGLLGLAAAGLGDVGGALGGHCSRLDRPAATAWACTVLSAAWARGGRSLGICVEHAYIITQ